MRLTALSRKIDKTPKQLTEFLEKKGIAMEKGLHSKLDTETVSMVLAHFLPEGEQESESTKAVIEEKTVIGAPEASEETEEVLIAQPETNKPEEHHEATEVTSQQITAAEMKQKAKTEIPVQTEEFAEMPEPKTGTVDDMESEEFEKVELIKAKKVKLEGFKVVGKIELPDKPVKVEKAAAEEAETQNTDKPAEDIKPRKQRFDRDRKKNRGAKLRNPLSYEERLKREEREKARKQKKKLREEKMRRKKLYEETVQAKVVKSPKKKKYKKNTAKTQSVAKPVVHKNPFKRLWAWLNGKYDRF